ncbi:MAG: class I SAM-dependent methyltransferase [Hyphomicrobiales bacterium]|nr:class I SAM-dependent methyltransferase [Hyphomicrobiales bacterium]MCP5001678.1 class I SAM-dependent methyltransferase [Hyphomicrobiales bacterium]
MNKAFEVFQGDKSDTQRWCPLCGGFEQTGFNQYSVSPWRIVACANCDFVYLANPVTYRDLEVDQAWEANTQRENQRRQRERPVLNRLSKGTRFRLKLGPSKPNRFRIIFKQGRVLDVGCGTGNSLPSSIVPFGIEISRHLAKKADESFRKIGGRCVQADAISGIRQFADRHFNGILLHSFLEHETNPLPLLVEAQRVLDEKGVVYVRVPNFSSVNRRVMGHNWCGFRYPDHVNYFTSDTLRRMARLSGFDMHLLNWGNLIFDDNIKVVLKKAR